MTNTDKEAPEATPEAIDAYLGEPLRGCLVELVDECLQYKPEDVSEAAYFADTLEPLFRRLIADCLENRHQDTRAFVEKWVKEEQIKEQTDCTFDAGVPTPLSCMAGWCSRRAMDSADEVSALKAELEALRRKQAVLEEGLGRTPQGKRILQAAAEGDHVELDAALAAAGLLGERVSGDVHAVASGAPASSGETALVLRSRTAPVGGLVSPSAAEAEAAESMGAVLRALRDRGVKSASAAFAHFGPGDDGRIEAQHLLPQRSRTWVCFQLPKPSVLFRPSIALAPVASATATSGQRSSVSWQLATTSTPPSPRMSLPRS